MVYAGFSAGLAGLIFSLLVGCYAQTSERSEIQETQSTSIGGGNWGAPNSGKSAATGNGTQQQTFQAKDVTYIIAAQPIQLRQDLKPMLDKLRSRRGMENTLVCAQTIEIDGLFLCGGTTRAAQHIPLMRAAIYAEGRPSLGVQTSNQVVSNQVAASGYSKSYGHDIPQTTLQNFFSAAKASCPNLSCFLDGENVFAMKVMAEFQRRAPAGYSVISFDVEDEESINGALKHEIAHGQFFQQPAYRLAVQTFWTGLPPNIQLAAQTAIGMNYDVTNTELLINEFHAYILDGKFTEMSAESIANAKKYDFAIGEAMEVLAANARQLQFNLRTLIQGTGQPIWAGSL